MTQRFQTTVPPKANVVGSVFGRTGDVVAANGDYAASQITFTPYGFVADTDTQAALESIVDEVASISSAMLTTDTDGTLSANSDSRVATQRATKTYIDNSVVGLFDFKGAYDCSSNPLYPLSNKADAYVVSHAGKIGGSSGPEVAVGDVFISKADTAEGNHASVGSQWFILEHNLTGSGSGSDTIDEDGYGNNWHIYEDSLGTHQQLDRVVSRSTDTYAAEIEVDLAKSPGEWHRIETDGNAPTLNVVNFEHNDPAEPGKKFVLEVVKDASGDGSIDFAGSPQTWTFPDGEPALTTQPNGIDFLEFLVIDVETPEFLFIRPVHRPQIVTPSAVSATPTWGTLDDNLTGYWRFEETSGNRASEVGSRTLTDNNTVTSAAGQFGTAASFASASSEYLSRTHEAALGPQTSVNSGEFTIAVWVRFTTLAGTIISKRDWGSGVDAPNFLLDYTGNIRFATVLDDETNFEMSHSATISTNTWYFIVAVIDPANTRLRISIDGGAFENSSSWGGGKTVKGDPASGTTLRVGAGDTGGSAANFLNGRLDELAIYQRALTIGEVGTLMAGIGFGSNYEIDHARCDGALLTITGDGTHTITIENPSPLKTLFVSVTSDNATGTLVWAGATYEWGDAGPPDVPADGDTIYLKFECVSTSLILARRWLPSSAASALADLTDVTTTSPTVGDVLTWTGSEWENSPAATSSVSSATASTLANGASLTVTHAADADFLRIVTAHSCLPGDNTVLLLNGNGANNGTVFTDSSYYRRTLVAVGNVKTSTAQSKFGGASLAFDGSGDYLTCSGTITQLALGSGAWTIEAWIRLNVTTGVQVILDWRPLGSGGGDQPIFYVNAGTLIYDTQGFPRITGATLSANTWYHVAVCKSGSSTKMFIDGTQTGSTWSDSVTYTQGSADRPFIGCESATINASPFNGYIDDLRITKGTALYTGTFTPPASQLAIAENLRMPIVCGQTGINGFVVDFHDGTGADPTTKTRFTNNTGATLTDPKVIVAQL